MVQFTQLFTLVLAANIVAADGYFYHKDGFSVSVCSSLISKKAAYFNATLDKVGYCNVNNQPALGSMASCITRLPWKNSVQNFMDSCKKYDLTYEQFHAALENATNYFNNYTNDPDYSPKKYYPRPIKIGQKAIVGGWHSAIGRFMNYSRSSWYGVALVCYWMLVILLSGFINLLYFIAPGTIKLMKGKVVNTYRKYLTLPALFKKSHAHHRQCFRVIQVLFPSRLESFLVFVFFVLTLFFCSFNYAHDSPNLYWPKSESAEIGRKIADRTGLIVMYLIPQQILFAGRNNFLIWISGWSFSRFVIIHKWLSRFAFLLVMVHAVGMTYNGKGVGKYEVRNEEPYVRWGYVALVAAAVIMFQTLRVFRRSNYELFLLFHIILAVFWIAGGWIHTADAGMEQPFYAAVAIWVFDRVVRIARMVLFGVRDAHVKLVSNETLKVKISRPAFWVPQPNNFAFITFFRATCFWQSHPFTIIDSVEEKNTITFCVKVKGGMTHGLYQYLSKQPDQSAVIKCSVDGPYGYRSSVNRFENILLLAGGNGIPGLFAEAFDIVKRGMQKDSIKLYWVIRHYRSIEWFYSELMSLKNTSVQVVVYVTQPDVGVTEPIVLGALDSASEEEEIEEEEEQEKKSETHESNDYIRVLRKKFPFVDFREGRPDMDALVKEEMAQTSGPLGIMSCGHGSMMDDIRRTVANNLDVSSHRIELYEELQSF